MTAADTELVTLRSELAFEQLAVVISDHGRHWKFYFGDKHLADYWPASGKGQVIGESESIDCVSAAQAQKLAVNAKKQLFADIAKALQQPSVAAAELLATPHEAP